MDVFIGISTHLYDELEEISDNTDTTSIEMPQNAEDRQRTLTSEDEKLTEKSGSENDNKRRGNIKIHSDKWLLEEIQDYDEDHRSCRHNATVSVHTMKGNKASKIQTMQQLQMKLAGRKRSLYPFHEMKLNWGYIATVYSAGHYETQTHKSRN